MVNIRAVVFGSFSINLATAVDSQPARRICRPGPQLVTSEVTDKRVLIIGDSISLGQMGPLTRLLCPDSASNCTATVAHGPWSGDGGALDVKYAMDTNLEMTGAGAGPPWMPELNKATRFGDGCLNGTFLVTTTQEHVAYDVISFNYGVHDVDYGGYHEEWVPLELYRSNVRNIKHTLQQTGAQVLFQSSTPVSYNLTTNQRILNYNAAAKAVMAEDPPAAFNDLYKAITDVCGQPPYNAPDIPGAPNCSINKYHNVHYTNEGWQVLASSSAAAILPLLSQKATDPSSIIANRGAPVQCSGAQQPTACPSDGTCMENAFSNSGYGCCMGYGASAVQCSDKVHCCPEGWSCSSICKLGSCSCEPPATTPVVM
jgi:hypothetical protein